MATINSLVCWGGKDGKTVTLSIATPCVMTLTNHGLRNGMGVVFSTSGALPTGIVAGTTYYAGNVASGTANLYDTQANAIAGGATGRINTSGSQSGAHTAKGKYYSELSSKARWTVGGTEYIFDSIAAWNTYHTTTNPASAFDTHVCELGEEFNEYVPNPSLTNLSIPSAQNIVTSLVNGARSSAWHGGNYPGNAIPTALSKGFVLAVTVAIGSGEAVKLSRYNDRIEGFSIIQTATTGVGSLVRLDKGLTRCDRMFLVGGSTSSPTRCLWLNAPLCHAVGNAVLFGSRGIEISNTQPGLTAANNTVTRAATGMYAGTGPNGYIYNNLSLGNTTNWASATLTNVEGASNNAGLLGEAWIVGSGTRVTMATSDFADYANNNLRPAASNSPQVNAGVNFYGYPTSDLVDKLRPAYEDGTDVIDIGAYEWDFGNTPPDLSDVTISATVSLAGAEIRIYDLDNSPAGSLGTELAGTESNSGATYVYSGTPGNTVWIQILLAGYEEFGRSLTIPSSDLAYEASLVAERNA